jgi:hypothetical protein
MTGTARTSNKKPRTDGASVAAMLFNTDTTGCMLTLCAGRVQCQRNSNQHFWHQRLRHSQRLHRDSAIAHGQRRSPSPDQCRDQPTPLHHHQRRLRPAPTPLSQHRENGQIVLRFGAIHMLDEGSDQTRPAHADAGGRWACQEVALAHIRDIQDALAKDISVCDCRDVTLDQILGQHGDRTRAASETSEQLVGERVRNRRADHVTQIFAEMTHVAKRQLSTRPTQSRPCRPHRTPIRRHCGARHWCL